MRRSHLLLALVGFAAGLAAGAGAALLVREPAAEVALATGGVLVEVTNTGTKAMEARVVLLDARGLAAFSSVFEVEPGATVRRSVVSLPAGSYTAELRVPDDMETIPFGTDDCPGRILLTFFASASPRGSIGSARMTCGSD